MDQRGLDGCGLHVLSALGNAITSNGECGYPATVAFTPTWQSQAHYAQNPGFTDQVSGSIVATPDEIRSRIALVASKFTSLDTDIRQNISRPDFLAAWATFKKTWDDFAAKNQSTLTLLTTGTGTVNRQVDAFEVDLRGWQDAMVREAPQGHFITAPVTSSAQAVQLPLPPGGTKPTGPGGLPWWAISVMTIGGLGLIGYLGYRAYKKISPAHALLSSAHDAGYDPAPTTQHVHYYGGH